VDARPTVRDEAAYDALLAEARRDHDAALQAGVHDLIRVLDAWRAADKALSGRAELATLPALTDMRAQVGRIIAPGFVGEAGAAQLREIPRYLAAVQYRRERLDSQVARDRQLMDQIADLQDAWLHQVAALPDGRPPSASQRAVRWMLEEYRVSLWAQHLGTRHAVSDQRIRKALA
jgi:ATP-dependent helicase HrpA